MKWNVKEIFSLRAFVVGGSAAAVFCLSVVLFWPQDSQHSSRSTAKEVVHKDKKKTNKKISQAGKVHKKPKAHFASQVKKRSVSKIAPRPQKSELAQVTTAKNKVASKRTLKSKQRLVAGNKSSGLRSWEHLGRDGWNTDHEQVETLTENVGQDPTGAESFEDSRISDEISAAGF